jgi:hypothetical protein
MANTLHNKIYLGRRSVLASRGWQALFAVGALAGMALALIAARSSRKTPALPAEAPGGYHVSRTSLNESGNEGQRTHH